ncbi:uncharacterized protein GIQ15_01616 [Arthroderma uncinatum]|uniref:uncharacterized protein n=1 Tax=Arthroderma uncinatum TaxID=74035 RepID=UPI00144A9C04|nr:uncharacterized protein GIQ15_01616 [Arthroderma uncinatum]KAF3492099.1 hypothetical protein GIQ15_01616 [Arthroderma uncinatum]
MGVIKYTIYSGSGDYPAQNDEVKAAYLCYLKGNNNQEGYREEKQVIMKGDPGCYKFRIGEGQVISGSITSGIRSVAALSYFLLGFEEGVSHMRPNELSFLDVTSDRACGDMGFPGSIPPNSDMLFLVRIESITRPDSERIYGCTFKDCIRLFGNYNAWVEHERKQHCTREIWRCAVANQNGEECAKLFERAQTFRQHLKGDHGCAPEPEEDYVSDCYIGGDYQGRFWCGFCRKTCPVAEEGFEAMEKRHEHVGGHFKDGQSITEWVDAGGREPNWSSTPDRVLEVVGLPTPECVILQNGLISRARAISHTSLCHHYTE